MPPKFIENRTSSDVEVKEGESVDLRCAAQATPDPEIRWRRESNQEIQVRSGSSTKKGKLHCEYHSACQFSAVDPAVMKLVKKFIRRILFSG